MRIRLRDGRHIGLEQHGDGTSLIWLPGTPGSRLWQPPGALGDVRLIVVERPGFGQSDPRPGRTILDWADDLSEVADALGLARFALAGTSGAGPYLLACGARLGDRITRLGLIACLAPLDGKIAWWRRASLFAARQVPSLMKKTLPRDPGKFYRLLTRDAPPCDRAVLARIWSSQVAMTAEALRQGPDAFVEELILATQPWGFAIEEVRCPTVLWHGSEDAATPMDMARRVAARLPDCRAHFLDGAGHFLHYDRWGEVLASLV